jgi:hypothetical protein
MNNVGANMALGGRKRGFSKESNLWTKERVNDQQKKSKGEEAKVHQFFLPLPVHLALQYPPTRGI